MREMSFGRILTAMVTPMNEALEINYEEAVRLAQYLIGHGSDSVVVCGTTGEAPTVTADEKVKLFKVVKEALGKTPVIAGIGSYSTDATIALARQAEATGVDGFLVVVPYYNKPSEEGLYRHFTTIADEAALPVVLYNVPGRSSVNMSVSLLLRLAQHPGIVAVKEASGSMSQIEDLLNKRPTTFSVLSGDDALTLPMVACGAQGIISVAGNMFPKEMVDMTHAALAGDMRKALQIHNHLYPFFVNQFIETNPVPIKTYMASKGMMEEVFRLPLCELREQNRKTLLATFG